MPVLFTIFLPFTDARQAVIPPIMSRQREAVAFEAGVMADYSVIKRAVMLKRGGSMLVARFRSPLFSMISRG